MGATNSIDIVPNAHIHICKSIQDNSCTIIDKINKLFTITVTDTQLSMIERENIIKSCNVFVFVYSDTSINSHLQNIEIDIATRNYKPIVGFNHSKSVLKINNTIYSNVDELCDYIYSSYGNQN